MYASVALTSIDPSERSDLHCPRGSTRHTWSKVVPSSKAFECHFCRKRSNRSQASQKECVQTHLTTSDTFSGSS